MDRLLVVALLVAAIVLSVAVVEGCSDHSRMMNMSTHAHGPRIMKVVPEDGATDVPIGGSIHMKFDSPMDTLSVENNFHLVGGQEMHEWMGTFDNHGHMNGGMMDMDHMMAWMDSIDHDGHFNWNDEMDSCEFVPGSTCAAQTEYMIFMNGQIMGLGGGMMQMDHLDYDGYLFHFTTGMMGHTDEDLGTDPRDRRDDFSHNHEDGGAEFPQMVSIWPSDGMTGASPSTTVGIRFNMPMDTLSVMNAFQMSGGSGMEEWMDSLDHHGHMGGGMMDMEHMMEWMDSIEHYGQFHWNDAMDSCEFIPDTLCLPYTEYMLIMYGDMMGRNGMMMDMSDLEYEAHMFHFVTGP